MSDKTIQAVEQAEMELIDLNKHYLHKREEIRSHFEDELEKEKLNNQVQIDKRLKELDYELSIQFEQTKQTLDNELQAYRQKVMGSYRQAKTTLISDGIKELL